MCSAESEVKAASKRKLKVLNLSDKVELILEIEKNPHIKKKILAEKYGIPPNTLSTILKNKTIILERYVSNVNPQCKKVKACAFPQVESALIAWCKAQRLEHGNIPISGVMLREKAMDLAKSIGAEDFKGSTGWLDNFKARYKIFLNSLTRNIEDATDDSQTDEEEPLFHVLKCYDADNIFIIEESVLFYNFLQSKTEDKSPSEGHSLANTGSSVIGQNSHSPLEDKPKKNKFTIVIGANASGTEKFPLVVVGKEKIQLSFEDEKSLSVEYYTNKSARMTCELFVRYIRKLDHLFHSRERKILLLVGNCHAHFRVSDLQAIKLETLPSNPSALLKSADKSLVKCLKHEYQEHLARVTTGCVENGVTNIDVFQAITILSSVWDRNISQNMITDSFKLQGILTNQQMYNANLPSLNYDKSLVFTRDVSKVNIIYPLRTENESMDVCVLPSSDTQENVSVNQYEGLNISSSNFVNQPIVVTADVSNENILDNIKTENVESVEDICFLTESPSDTEVTMAIGTIERYLSSRTHVDKELFQHLQKISDFVLNQKRKL